MSTPTASATNTNEQTGGPTQRRDEMVTRLQRGLLRLAFSFHGQNAELDSKLTQLGQLIRKGRKDEELCARIDDAINTMVRLDC
ncbi:MAG: hypothetical protein KJO38_02365, partial [Gammaproteobacteria bacterium]|nr:hypothetical protein [Gammaproteobacteria bacterium]